MRFGFGAGPFRSVIVASPMLIRSPAASAAVLTTEPFRVTSVPGEVPRTSKRSSSPATEMRACRPSTPRARTTRSFPVEAPM